MLYNFQFSPQNFDKNCNCKRFKPVHNILIIILVHNFQDLYLIEQLRNALNPGILGMDISEHYVYSVVVMWHFGSFSNLYSFIIGTTQLSEKVTVASMLCQSQKYFLAVSNHLCIFVRYPRFTISSAFGITCTEDHQLLLQLTANPLNEGIRTLLYKSAC